MTRLTAPLSPQELEDTLRAIGRERYHNLHPFHHLLHGGKLSLDQVRAWALNRFFDKASTSPGAGSLSRQATFNVDGHQVTLEFAPNSIRNPFQLPRFSCP